MPVIGFLRSTAADGFAHLVTSFRRGLNEAGFIEGQNVAIESICLVVEGALEGDWRRYHVPSRSGVFTKHQHSATGCWNLFIE